MGRGLRIVAVAVVAAAWGCFSAPSADVLFSCDPSDAPECPPDYTCESDGCCHRNGSDVEASRNACNSGATSGFDPSTTEGSTDGSSTDTDPGSSSGSGESTDTDTDTAAGSSGSSEG
jgi:hypothetical protein